MCHLYKGLGHFEVYVLTFLDLALQFQVVMDTENIDSSEIQIGNITATFIKKDGRTSVYWFTPTSLFELDSTLTDEEIVTIIQNLMVYDN